MNVNLQSGRISLQVYFDHSRDEEELWHSFRRTAVEPGQASFPDLVSFADECLLCAQIFLVEGDKSLTDDDLVMEAISPPAAAASGAHARDSALDPELATSTQPPRLEDRRVGFIYLYAGPANLPAGEANVGVIIRHGVQGRGYAREAVQLVLRWAFEELKFHRVQAAVLDTPFKDKALRLFIGSGFAHEGTRRRSVYQPEGEGRAGMWKDVTYLAMLDTEWMLRSALAQRSGLLERPAVSAWDEMFARHSREREELLRWEEMYGRMKKSASTETLRESGRCARQDLAYLTDDAASSVGEPSIRGLSPSPGPSVFVTWEENMETEDRLTSPYEADQLEGWERVVESSFASRRRHHHDGGSFLDLSPRGPTLALPSIPSTRTRLSEGNPQSPITIPSPSSIPPFSPSPSPEPSSPRSSWSNSADEENWLQTERCDPALENPWTDNHFTTTPHEPENYLKTTNSSWRPRSSSVSSNSSTESDEDAWSDAHSSTWDMISDSSDQGSEYGQL